MQSEKVPTYQHSPYHSPPPSQLVEAIEETRRILNIPADYRIAVVPASDTGAIEMAMWSMLGTLGQALG